MFLQQYRTVVALASLAIGVVVAILGYLGVSNETEVAFQLPYFASAGVAALLLFGFGAALLLSVQLDRDTETIDDLERAVRQLAEEVKRLSDEVEPPRGTARRRNGHGATSEARSSR